MIIVIKMTSGAETQTSNTHTKKEKTVIYLPSTQKESISTRQAE